MEKEPVSSSLFSFNLKVGAQVAALENTNCLPDFTDQILTYPRRLQTKTTGVSSASPSPCSWRRVRRRGRKLPESPHAEAGWKISSYSKTARLLFKSPLSLLPWGFCRQAIERRGSGGRSESVLDHFRLVVPEDMSAQEAPAPKLKLPWKWYELLGMWWELLPTSYIPEEKTGVLETFPSRKSSLIREHVARVRDLSGVRDRSGVRRTGDSPRPDRSDPVLFRLGWEERALSGDFPVRPGVEPSPGSTTVGGLCTTTFSVLTCSSFFLAWSSSFRSAL